MATERRSLNGTVVAITGGAREAVGRALKGDQVLAGADPQARAAYEARAARSEPSVDGEGAADPQRAVT